MSGTAILVENPPVELKSLEATLKEVAVPISRAKGEDTFDGLADMPMSEERPALRIWSTKPCSSASLENTVGERIASIQALVEDTVVLLFGDAGRATESSPNIKVLSGIQSVVNR